MKEFLKFNDVSFTYPPMEGDIDSEGKQIIPRPVFDHFSGELPGGFVSLIGPNGCGKSTFLMLASGRICPNHGQVSLLGENVTFLNPEQKNLLASVIYQNMEFESDESVAALLDYVYKNGSLKGNAAGVKNNKSNLLDEVINQFELKDLLHRPLTAISKGEIQRVQLVFSLLYGSPAIFMDEPLFAMEYKQMEKALSYLKMFCLETGTSIYISIHDLDLTRKYAQKVLLFYPNRDMDFGTPEEVMTDEALEKAYGVPASMLKHQESMTRETLVNSSEAAQRMREVESGK